LKFLILHNPLCCR